MSFSESVFLVGFIQKTIKVDLYVRVNRKRMPFVDFEHCYLTVILVGCLLTVVNTHHKPSM